MRKVIFLLFTALLLSCGDIDSCTSDSNQEFMILRFYDAETLAAKKVGFRISANESTLLFGFGTDSDSLAIGLPLDPEDTTVLFHFDTDTIDHTLHVKYKTEISIFDPNCDPSVLFIGLDTLSSTFDSTAIIGTVTDRELTTNIEVYF